MNKSKYLPSDPASLILSMESTLALPDGAKVIGVIVVIEDAEAVETAALADHESQRYVLRSLEHVVNNLRSGLPVASFNKNSETPHVNH